VEAEPDDEEIVAAALDATPTLGTWTDGSGRVRAYYPSGVEPADAFRDAWRAVAGGRRVPTLSVRDVEPRDWLAGYRAAARPVRVSDRLWVAPPDAVCPEQGRVVRIQPGTGFGTGTHATTRALLEWIDRDPTSGRVVDVGTGSGVLALVAAALGAAFVVGLDTDPAALENARDNRDRNRAGPVVRLVRGSIAAIRSEERFDRVLANLDGTAIRTLLPRLAGACAPDGRVGLAGLLAGEREGVLERAGSADLVLVDEIAAGDDASGDSWWSAWLARA